MTAVYERGVRYETVRYRRCAECKTFDCPHVIGQLLPEHMRQSLRAAMNTQRFDLIEAVDERSGST